MVKLYYGNGNCSIDNNKIVGIQIHYKGKIAIKDRTPFNYVINSSNNIILIFSIQKGQALSELFEYEGEFKVISVIASDGNAERVPVLIRKVLDYSEFINSKSEDMTTKSENLDQGFVSGGKVPKTFLKEPNIKNLNTDDWDIQLYTKNRNLYEGEFEIVLKNSMAITPDGQELYFKSNGKFMPTKNERGIPQNTLYKKAKRTRDNNRLKKASKNSRVRRY